MGNRIIKKLFALLITIVLTMGFFIVNNKRVNAEENATCSSSSTSDCTISNYSQLSGWASNSRNIKGTLTSNISLTSGLTISTTKTLDLAGYEIKAANTLDGTMFTVTNTGSLTVKDSSGNNSGKINGGYSSSTKHNNNIRGFRNSGILKIQGGTITNMHVETNNPYGAGIRNMDGASLTMSGGVIQNCYAIWGGGAICHHEGATFTMSGGSIKDSIAGERGGAICGYANFTISGGSITGCKSPTGAVTVSGKTQLTLSGNTTFNNTNDLNNKDDIYLRNTNSTILVKSGFSQSSGNKIAIWTSIPLDSSTSYKVVIKDSSYTGTLDTLAGIFISAHGQEYVVKTSNSLSIKGVAISQQPMFSNEFEVKTNKADTTNPITVSYQWYKSIIDAETSVKGTGSYVLGKGETFETNFTIGTDSSTLGSYDGSKVSWSMTTQQNQSRLFKISGLKSGQVISFYFKASNSNYTDIFLSDANENYFEEYISKESSGKYTITIPSDLNNKAFYVCLRFKNSSDDFIKATISNILVKKRQDPVKIKGATTGVIENAVPGADNFCKLTFKNTNDGSVNTLNSADVEFGKVTKGNDQTISVGSKGNVTIILDKSEDKTYLDVSSMEVYLDGLKTANKVATTNYTIVDSTSNAKTVTLTLKGSYLTTLSSGDHTFYVKMSTKDGYECTPLNLKINPFYWGIDSNNVLHISDSDLSATCTKASGSTDGKFTSKSNQPWVSYADTITSVIIDKEIKPAKTAYWFEGLSKATYMNISNLNTEIDTDTTNMFKNCSKVETIKASSKFTNSGITSGTDMFTGCTSLVGGNGTKFNTSYKDKTYARFDNNGQVKGTIPGYFTQYNKLKFDDSNNTGVSITYSCRDLNKDVVVGTLNSTTKTGYIFSWNTKKDGKGTTYTASTKMPDAETTIYALFTPITYTVKYDKNSGTGTDMTDSTFTYDSATDKLNKNTYTKTGYTFQGWSTDKSATTATYTDEQTSTKFNLTSTNQGSVTLYAVWKANDYTVTLDPKDGTGGTASVTATYDSAMPTATMPTKTGYKFNGYWSTETDETVATNKYYNANGTSAKNWDKASNTTLYAHWVANTYKVKYDKNSGTGTDMTDSEFTYDSTTDKLKKNTYTKTGYTFQGWSTDKSATIATYTDEQTGTKFNLTSTDQGSVTLYAVWKANTYTVKYNKNSGTGTAMTDSTFTYDSTTDKLEKNTYTKTGYSFLGWSTDSTATTATYTDEQTGTKFNLTSTDQGSVTLYAVWKANQYTVVLDQRGGTGGTNAVTATYDAAMPAATMPTKNGFEFKGYWDAETDELLSNKYYNVDGTSAMNWDKPNDAKLYAHWLGNNYTVIYNANGGYGHMDSEEFTYDDETQHLSLNKFKRDDYTFKGWSTDRFAVIPTYSDGQYKPNVTDVPNATVTLYAVWRRNPQPIDERCEKVLGPTWHWNDKKGICEEASVVKTYSR